MGLGSSMCPHVPLKKSVEATSNNVLVWHFSSVFVQFFFILTFPFPGNRTFSFHFVRLLQKCGVQFSVSGLVFSCVFKCVFASVLRHENRLRQLTTRTFRLLQTFKAF